MLVIYCAIIPDRNAIKEMRTQAKKAAGELEHACGPHFSFLILINTE